MYLLLLFLLMPNWGEANTETLLSAAPRSVHTLVLKISGVQSDYKRYGLDKAKLVEHITQQLKQAGFHVIPAEGIQSSPAAPLLQVDLDLVSSYLGYSYALSVKLVQKVKLADPQDNLIPVVTWSTGRSGFLRITEIADLNNYITSAVERFIKATPPNR